MTQHTPGPQNRKDATGRSGEGPDRSPRPGDSPFTQGPWQIVQAANGRVSVYPLGGKERVLDVYCPLDRDGGTLGGNARLIAAAPEMYAMLKHLIRVDGDPLAESLDITQIADAARALLARIEGET
mgnify:CR=1 FL=1